MIQFRRFASLIVGLWLAGSVFMDVAAFANFRAVDRFLADPGIASATLIHNAGRENVRILLRRGAGEANGWLFEQWEWIELGIGLALLLVLIFGERPPKLPIALCLGMTILVLVERFALTPNLIRMGREIEPPRNFNLFHRAYAILDLAKIAIGLAIAGILVIRRRPDPRMFAREADAFTEL